MILLKYLAYWEEIDISWDEEFASDRSGVSWQVSESTFWKVRVKADRFIAKLHIMKIMYQAKYESIQTDGDCHIQRSVN